MHPHRGDLQSRPVTPKGIAPKTRGAGDARERFTSGEQKGGASGQGVDPDPNVYLRFERTR